MVLVNVTLVVAVERKNSKLMLDGVTINIEMDGAIATRIDRGICSDELIINDANVNITIVGNGGDAIGIDTEASAAQINGGSLIIIIQDGTEDAVGIRSGNGVNISGGSVYIDIGKTSGSGTGIDTSGGSGTINFGGADYDIQVANGKEFDIGQGMLIVDGVVIAGGYRGGGVKSYKAREKDSPTPIVAVLYDVEKAGDAFTFKTIIANANGSLPGSTVRVTLNEKHSTTVTVAEDGVGYGTLEAPGFAGEIANFHTRPNVRGAAGVATPFVVYSTGDVARR